MIDVNFLFKRADVLVGILVFEWYFFRSDKINKKFLKCGIPRKCPRFLRINKEQNLTKNCSSEI